MAHKIAHMVLGFWLGSSLDKGLNAIAEIVFQVFLRKCGSNYLEEKEEQFS
jgi:hypothetical protein